MPAVQPSDANPSGPAPAATTPEEAVPLCQLETGDRGRIVTDGLCCEDCELLRAMGLNEESLVRVCRSGAPCIVLINTTRLGLSAAMSQRILVART